MVRFARADGSKGSNKRQLEEPTPWSDMVAQMEESKKRKKTKDEGEGKKHIEVRQELGNKDKVKQETQNSTMKNKNVDGREDKNENTTKNTKLEKGLKAQTINQNQKQENATQSTVRKTKKERKKERAANKETEYTITPEGQRVKVFRDGTERTWFDLPYEESDAMTRYEGMWVKKDMVKKLDKLKEALQDEGLEKKQIMKKMMKAKRKAHKELRIELIYEQKRLVTEAMGEEAVTVKRSKNQKKKKKSKAGTTTNDNMSRSPTIKENDTAMNRSKRNTNAKRKGRRENKEDGIASDDSDNEEGVLMSVDNDGVGDKETDSKREIKKGGKVKKEEFVSDNVDEEADNKEENEEREDDDKEEDKTDVDEEEDDNKEEEENEERDDDNKEGDKIESAKPKTNEKTKKNNKITEDTPYLEENEKVQVKINTNELSDEEIKEQKDGKVRKKRKRKEKETEDVGFQTDLKNEDITETLKKGVDVQEKVRKRRKSKGCDVEKTESQTDLEINDGMIENTDMLGNETELMAGEKRKKKTKVRLETEETEQDFEIQNDNEVNTEEPVIKNKTDLRTSDKTMKKVRQEMEGTEVHLKIQDNSEAKTEKPLIENADILNLEKIPQKEEYKNYVSENEEHSNMRNDNEEHKSFNSYKSNMSPQKEFYESELMTNYEGYWVLREDVEVLNEAKEAELKAIYDARMDGNVERELTREEQITFQRAVKKRKRFHNKKLMQRMARMGRRGDDRDRTRKDRKKDEDSEKAVKFDGFWIKKEAADRLNRLRSKLHNEGLSKQEVDSVIQKERRKEERVLKNERKLLCLNCRQPGHMVSACPNIKQAEGEEGQPSICYTCGSTEHTSSTCNLKKGSDKSFSFATCYICGESGHISRQCPDNPRGLYPKGGACRGCGSVEHLAKDCPDLQKEKEETNIRVRRMKGDELEALDEELDEGTTNNTSSSNNKLKVVTF